MIVRRLRVSFSIVALVAVTACGSGGGSGNDAGQADASDDNGNSTGNCPAVEVPPDWTYPAGPFGTGVGDTFADITLNDCNGNPVVFGDLLGSGEMVLFNVAAGWCVSCIGETEEMEQDVYQAFCNRGLRIMQVLVEDQDSYPADGAFCAEWKDNFSLTFPVVTDPEYSVEAYMGGASIGQLPLNVLVGHDGKILYFGIGDPPADFVDQIDGWLPE